MTTTIIKEVIHDYGGNSRVDFMLTPNFGVGRVGSGVNGGVDGPMAIWLAIAATFLVIVYGIEICGKVMKRYRKDIFQDRDNTDDGRLSWPFHR